MTLFALLTAVIVLVVAAAFSRRVPTGRAAVLRVGVDIVDVSWVAAALASARSRRYLDLVYTTAEQRDCALQDGIDPGRLAARFAAKEAVWKALGDSGMTLPWKSVEVVRTPGGEPHVRLHGPAAAVAERLGLRAFAVSLSHEPDYATAVVVASR